MVAKVITGKHIAELIGYNEQKVKRGVAECLLASGFLKDENRLTRSEKVARFTRLHERNRRTKTNALHIPISFSPEEKLSKETLSSIASAYMDKIGFGEQPFLVYLHRDTNIQHLHIVSTLIQEDGRRIPVHNIGRNQSARARRELEVEYSLVKADARGRLKRMLREPRKHAIKKLVDQVIVLPSVRTLDDFVRTLKQKKIDVRLHTNAEGRTFGITFQDPKTSALFKGSELGKAYSVNAILTRIGNKENHRVGDKQLPSSIVFGDREWRNSEGTSNTQQSGSLFENLVGDGYGGKSPEVTLSVSKRKKRKKKRRRI
ncbi:relaxase/mobilization nuclease domain-containing protein [Parachryseolinea silvisoli]|uniref:relaxase/mobilization nuclease domain-containing protein n=1 Tax=Parachryseolinea silvisoli TaxID=2873601 RepID=UPI002265F66C|nr:relaxase/mobilization nuclease domain-containing protein [Parachryseolinea silvisoli]MCD9015220.1 relaxase/mobilization nuclease domain-containing protein [Parachryseolinea silvisoli]